MDRIDEAYLKLAGEILAQAYKELVYAIYEQNESDVLQLTRFFRSDLAQACSFGNSELFIERAYKEPISLRKAVCIIRHTVSGKEKYGKKQFLADWKEQKIELIYDVNGKDNIKLGLVFPCQIRELQEKLWKGNQESDCD